MSRRPPRHRPADVLELLPAEFRESLELLPGESEAAYAARAEAWGRRRSAWCKAHGVSVLEVFRAEAARKTRGRYGLGPFPGDDEEGDQP